MADIHPSISVPYNCYRENHIVSNSDLLLQSMMESNPLNLAMRSNTNSTIFCRRLSPEQLARVTSRHHFFFYTFAGEDAEEAYADYIACTREIWQKGGNFFIGKPLYLRNSLPNQALINNLIKRLAQQMRMVYPYIT